MKLKTLLVALPIAALALLGAQASALAAAEQSAPGSVVVADTPTPSVSIHTDYGANGVQVAEQITRIQEKDRGEFVRRAVDAAFAASGSRYNVIMMNLSQGYNDRLQGLRLYGNVRWGAISYGLWIAEAGQFTNTGDGGYINWGFKGWYNRDGMTVNFYRP